MITATGYGTTRIVNWAEMPDELLLRIFAHLSCYTLARAAQSCQRWRQVVGDRLLWPVDHRFLRAARQGSVYGVAGSIMRSTGRPKHVQVASDAILFEDAYGVRMFSLDGERLQVVKCSDPRFPVSRIERVNSQYVLIHGPDKQVSVFDMRTEAMCAHYAPQVEAQRDVRLVVTSSFAIRKQAGSITIVSHDAKTTRAIPLEGTYRALAYCQTMVALCERFDRNERVRLMNWETGEELKRIEGPSFGSLRLIGEHLLFSTQEAGAVKHWLFISHRDLCICLPGPYLFRDSVVTDPTKRYLFCPDLDGRGAVYDLHTGEIVIDASRLAPIDSIAMWEERLVVYTSVGQLCVFNLKTRQQIYSQSMELQSDEDKVPSYFRGPVMLLCRRDGIFLLDIQEGVPLCLIPRRLSEDATVLITRTHIWEYLTTEAGFRWVAWKFCDEEER